MDGVRVPRCLESAPYASGCVHGPELLVESLSQPGVTDRYGNRWQYHPRSDRHSKLACWGIAFDLLSTSALLRRHVAEGRVTLGLNHRMVDFGTGRAKNLDLVFAALTVRWVGARCVQWLRSTACSSI
jgi:hypothetical protein